MRSTFVLIMFVLVKPNRWMRMWTRQCVPRWGSGTWHGPSRPTSTPSPSNHTWYVHSHVKTCDTYMCVLFESGSSSTETTLCVHVLCPALCSYLCPDFCSCLVSRLMSRLLLIFCVPLPVCCHVSDHGHAGPVPCPGAAPAELAHPQLPRPQHQAGEIQGHVRLQPRYEYLYTI